MSVDGVAEVEVIGGTDPVVKIELDPEKMTAMNVEPEKLWLAL